MGELSMPRRTIYVRDEDEALFDRLAADGKLSAVIARAVKADQTAETGPLPPRAPVPEALTLFHNDAGKLLEFTVEPLTERTFSSIQTLLAIDPVRLETGRSLVPFLDPNQGSPILEAVGRIRSRLAVELGFVLPGVRFQDSARLGPEEYVVHIREVEVGRGSLHMDRLLAVSPRRKAFRMAGIRTQDPTYGLPAVWIEPAQRADAEARGLLPFEPVEVLATHLTHLAQIHAHSLLGFQEMDSLLAPLRETHPALLEAALPDAASRVRLWHVLTGLLREQVSIRDLPLIVESLLDASDDPLEAARRQLRAVICHSLYARDGALEVVALDEALETQAGEGALDDGDRTTVLSAMSSICDEGRGVVLLTRPTTRRFWRDAVASAVPAVTVLSSAEIPDGRALRVLQTVGRGA
jgi:flagellar biosynthesis protein FlhA